MFGINQHYSVKQLQGHFLRLQSEALPPNNKTNISIVLLSSFRDSKSWILNHWTTDLYHSMGCQELGHTTGVEWWADEQSFIYCSPSLTLHLNLLPSHPCPVYGQLVFLETGSLVSKRLGTAAANYYKVFLIISFETNDTYTATKFKIF